MSEFEKSAVTDDLYATEQNLRYTQTQEYKNPQNYSHINTASIQQIALIGLVFTSPVGNVFTSFDAPKK
jgi:hypothetical protein